MFFFHTVMATAKRQRKQTERYGKSSQNMDAMFKDIDDTASTSHNDSDFVESDRQQSDISDSDQTEQIPLKDNGSKTTMQMARLEAKLNEMHSILMQVHRACISNAVSTQIESENVHELPLTSDDSLNKFEQDLAQKSYREKIVSMNHFQIASYHSNCIYALRFVN